jgi:hypothetical protein
MADSIPEKLETMFARFLWRRRARRFIWTPAVDLGQRRLVVTLMEFGH